MGWGVGNHLRNMKFKRPKIFPLCISLIRDIFLSHFQSLTLFPASVKGTATLNKEQSILRKNLNNDFEHIFIIVLMSAKISGSKKSEKIYTIVNPL